MSEVKNRFSKPVAFNRTNPEDQKRLSHLKGVNFSGYVKGLIDEDIKRKQRVAQKTSGGGLKIVIKQ